MEKPTVFFSHSSKDKDALIVFKSRFCEITCGVVNVFLSSDGESIPFGTNWVHKIDEGLKDAKIMFIFVTSNSVVSNWIYFEAGYAFARGIRVIPVGLGMDIAILKPPLSLLQGFNINSGDSLNNFIAITNSEFQTNFKESFIEDDYSMIDIKLKSTKRIDITELFSEVRFTVPPKFSDDDIVVDINQLFNDLIVFLDTSKTPYSSSRDHTPQRILVRGAEIEFSPGSKPLEGEINVDISTYNLDDSFDIIKSWLSEHCKRERSYLKFVLNDKVKVLTEEVSISALIHKALDTFSVIPETPNLYKYKSLNFIIFRERKQPVLTIQYMVNDARIEEMYELIQLLVEMEIIQI